MMKRTVVLKNSTSSVGKAFVGKKGTIELQSDGRFKFETEDKKGFTTSPYAPETLIGSLGVFACKSISFDTKTGSQYDFDFVDRGKDFGYEG